MTAPSTTARLLAQLEHGTEFDAIEAAKALSNAKSTKLITNLTKILRSGERACSREAAAYALSWLNAPKAAEALLLCAADANELDLVRGQATEGLAMNLRWASPKNGLRLRAEELMMELLDSPSPVLRFWACFGLGSLLCQRAIPQLRKLANEDASLCPGWWFVSEEAEDALEWIAGRPGKERTAVHLRNARSK
jgi:HEAT repeat protein